MKRRRALAACIALCLAALPAAGQQKELERTGGPFVPTPQIVVDHMLRVASVGPKDFVVDLGSGDGVIVLTAASQMKASGYGVDIDPALVQRANAEAKRLGIADRASFRVQDVFLADVSRASVITLYLLPSMMINLRSKLLAEARPGTRVVSHDYTFDDWQPDDQIVLDVPEKEKINGVPKATISLWLVPARVQGKWQVQLDSGERYAVAFQQKYQVIRGSAEAGAKPLKLVATSLRGADIDFTLSDGPTRRNFKGTATDDRMQGSVNLGGGRTALWTATRAD